MEFGIALFVIIILGTCIVLFSINKGLGQFQIIEEPEAFLIMSNKLESLQETIAGIKYGSRLSVQILSGNDALCFKSGLADQVLCGRVGLAKGLGNGVSVQGTMMALTIRSPILARTISDLLMPKS